MTYSRIQKQVKFIYSENTLPPTLQSVLLSRGSRYCQILVPSLLYAHVYASLCKHMFLFQPLHNNKDYHRHGLLLFSPNLS